MKKTISITLALLLALLLALPALAAPPGRGRAPARFAPPPVRRPPVMRAAPYRRPGPRRPVPPPPPPRFDPFVAGVLGLGSALLAPRYAWVEGHYETTTTVLPGGQAVTSTVWVPGRYVRIR